MDDLIDEIFAGFFRWIGYILADLFFGYICFWTGWPFCKIITVGRYPRSRKNEYFAKGHSSDTLSSMLGLFVWTFVGIYFLGGFN